MGKYQYKTIEQYKVLIADAKEQRSQLRKFTRGDPNVVYFKVAKNINRSIARWNCGIRRSLERERVMREVSDAINDYLHVIVEGSLPARNWPLPLARKIFAKYVLENFKMSSTYISRFVRSTDVRWAAATRKTFTKSFKTNLENRSFYHIVKMFIDEQRKS